MLLSLLAAFVVSACDDGVTAACTDQFVYGIVVTAVDATTGAAVTDGLQGQTIRDSTTSVMQVFGNTLLGAGETAGHFTVVVAATGYELWTRTNVEVTADECHVVPVHLTASLVRTSSG